MSITSSRLPLSLPNVILIGVSFAGAIATGILDNVLGTVLLLAVGVGGLLSALLARRAGASDLLRINAIEYRDERDTRLASHGFAVVGAWALALAALELVAATVYTGATMFTSTPGPGGGTTFTMSESSVFGGGLEAIAGLQLLVLAVVWGIANTRAVKRG